MWKYTTIIHDVRSRLGISCFEYCILDFIYRRQTYPKAPLAGWCTDSKEDIGTALGISRRWVFTAINKLVEAGLVETGNRHSIRTTEAWYVIAYTEGESKSAQSAQSALAESAQSAPPECGERTEIVHKVHSPLLDNKINKEGNETTSPIFHRSDGFEAPAQIEVTKYFKTEYGMNSSRFYNARESDLESIAFSYINARARIDWKTPAGVPIVRWQPDALNFLVSFGRNMNGDKNNVPEAPPRVPADENIETETRWRTVVCYCGSTFAVDINDVISNPAAQYKCPNVEMGKCDRTYTGIKLIDAFRQTGGAAAYMEELYEKE